MKRKQAINLDCPHALESSNFRMYAKERKHLEVVKYLKSKGAK